MRDTLAYARLYYLHENALVDRFGLPWKEEAAADGRGNEEGVRVTSSEPRGLS
jgi:hypothetical protein